jgi:pyruvate dehydrogenase E1 component
LPARLRKSAPIAIPQLLAFAPQLKVDGRPRDFHHNGLCAEFSIRCLRDKEIGKRIVPIVPDESPT